MYCYRGITGPVQGVDSVHWTWTALPRMARPERCGSQEFQQYIVSCVHQQPDQLSWH